MHMNGSYSIEKNDCGTGLGMLAILLAAIVVGLAFNSMSPLGVRASQTTVSGDASAATGQLYNNETIAVSLGAASPAGRPATAAPGGIYENETAGTRIEISPVKDAVQPAPQPGFRTISWLDTKKLLAAGQVVLIDARAQVYYETGHIPGAISLPAADALPEAFAAFAAKYPKDTPLVVYCGSVQCPLAAQLIGILTGSMGYTDVRDMAGGFVEYRTNESLPAGGGAK